MERFDRQLQHVGLPTACAVVYTKVTGLVVDASSTPAMQAVLNLVAHALSNVIVIYAGDAQSGLPSPLAPLDLIQGEFQRGAHVFRTERGQEVRGLTVQRRDLESAIAILKSAHIRFQLPG